MRVDKCVFYVCSEVTIDGSMYFTLTVSDAFSYIKKINTSQLSQQRSKYGNSLNMSSHSLSNMMTKRVGK